MAFDPAEYTGRREREQAEAEAQAQTAGFDPAAYLGKASPTGLPPGAESEFGAGTVAQLAAPAGMLERSLDRPMGYNPTAIREAAAPLRAIVPSTLAQYAATPSKLLADVAIPVMTGGTVPPLFAGFNALQAAGRVPGAVSESMDIVSKYASAADKNAFKNTGIFPEEIKTYRDLNATIKKIDPGVSQAMGDVLKDTRGGANKVLEFLKNVPEKIAQDPKFQQRLQAFQEAMPSGLQQAGRVAAPVLRTAARVAGPVGLGMDIYDAANYAQEADLGGRLAQGQGRSAQQAFRNMARTQQYGGLTPQEQAILEQDRIDQDIRRKAASKVLGPIAPGM